MSRSESPALGVGWCIAQRFTGVLARRKRPVNALVRVHRATDSRLAVATGAQAINENRGAEAPRFHITYGGTDGSRGDVQSLTTVTAPPRPTRSHAERVAGRASIQLRRELPRLAM